MKTGNYYDRDSLNGKGRRSRIRKLSNGSIKSNMLPKKKTPDFTDYAYREAVNRLKYLLAESYTPSKPAAIQYHKNLRDDSGDETESGTDRPTLSEVSKYLSPSFKHTRSSFTKMKPYTSPMTVKENYASPVQPSYMSANDYVTIPPPPPPPISSAPLIPDPGPAPPEILSYIEKQEDYIEQLEKESQFCRDELSNLLGKVRDVINENETITEHARADLAHIGSSIKVSGSSESEDNFYEKTRKAKKDKPKSSLSGPKIIFESRISELEAELAQSNIDLKKLRSENEDLKRKTCHSSDGGCDLHRKQIENLQRDKMNLEESLRKLQTQVDLLRTEGSKSLRSRDIADLAVFEKSQADMEIKHLRDELERQHERVREIQHEMARRISEERSNAERRYNYQVDQLGGDLSSQWEQVSRLQLELEREKRVQQDMKRDLQQRNAQIEELKTDLKAKRANFLSEIAQVNAEKQSLEQEITSLRLQLERSERQGKIEAARLSAEINSLRQRLDRADADILHARRENLRLTDDVSNLEKELTLGEIKNEVRPTRSDINKTITDMETKHATTVRELEDMIHNQKQLMDKLTAECKSLTSKLEDTSLKHNDEKKELRHVNEMLMSRLRQIWAKYKDLNAKQQSLDQSSDLEDKNDRNDDLDGHDKQHPQTSIQHLDMSHSKSMSHPQQSTNYQQNMTQFHQSNQEETVNQSQTLSQSQNMNQRQLPVHSIDSQHQKQNETSVPYQRPYRVISTSQLILENLNLTSPISLDLQSRTIPTSMAMKKMRKTDPVMETNTGETVISPAVIKSTPRNKVLTRQTATIEDPRINDTPSRAIQDTHHSMTEAIVKDTTNRLMTQASTNMTTDNRICHKPNTKENNQITKDMEPMMKHHTNETIQSISLVDHYLKLNQSLQSQQQYHNLRQSQRRQPFQHLHTKASQPSSRQRHQQSKNHQDQCQQQRHLEVNPNQKSVTNQDRASALWGCNRQISETKEDHFCRNSLPRRLKDYQVQQNSNYGLLSNPAELDPHCSISSPSLFDKSTDSDDSDTTLSPVRTAVEKKS